MQGQEQRENFLKENSRTNQKIHGWIFCSKKSIVLEEKEIERGKETFFEKVAFPLFYFPSAIERLFAAVTASITAFRKLFFSSAATPSIVVPAGEQTMSLRTAG